MSHSKLIHDGHILVASLHKMSLMQLSLGRSCCSVLVWFGAAQSISTKLVSQSIASESTYSNITFGMVGFGGPAKKSMVSNSKWNFDRFFNQEVELMLTQQEKTHLSPHTTDWFCKGAAISSLGGFVIACSGIDRVGVWSEKIFQAIKYFKLIKWKSIICINHKYSSILLWETKRY